jgi:ribosomal protein S5
MEATMAWKELIDESKIGAAGGVVGIDSAGKIAVPVAGFDRDITVGDMDITKDDVGLGNVENKSAADILAELTAGDIPDLDLTQITGLTAALGSKVPTTRTVQGKALSSNITLDKADVGLGKVEDKSVAGILAELTARDIPDLELIQVTGLVVALDSKVPTSRTVAGKALSSNITLDKADVGLGKVENKSANDIYNGLTTEHISATGVKTSDLINMVTTLPAVGDPGEIAMKDGVLYVWRD